MALMPHAEIKITVDSDQMKAALRKAMAEMITCSQCGQKLCERACGPTHAILAAQPERHRAVGWDQS